VAHTAFVIGTNDPSVGDQVCRFETDGPIIYCDAAPKPAVLQSGAPLAEGSGFDSLSSAVIDGPAISIPLHGSDPSSDDALTFSIESQPAHGTVTVDGATATYTPPSTSPAPATFDTFSYTLTTSSGTSTPSNVHVIFASPPVTTSSIITVVENQAKFVVLKARDPHGLHLTVTITDLPTSGTLYECDDFDRVVGEITLTQLPKTVGSIRLKYQPQMYSTTSQTVGYAGTCASAASTSRWFEPVVQRESLANRAPPTWSRAHISFASFLIYELSHLLALSLLSTLARVPHLVHTDAPLPLFTHVGLHSHSLRSQFPTPTASHLLLPSPWTS